jgi:dolichyl-phosphate beta-glucosyltransferase
MKRRLRRFLAVGLAITAIDVLAFLAFGSALDGQWAVGDVAAVLLAGVCSFVVHRLVTFHDDAYALIEHRPLSFALAALPAAATDVAVVAIIELTAEPDGAAVLGTKLLALLVAALVRMLTYRGSLFSAVRGRQQDVEPAEISGEYRVSVVLPAYNAELLVAAAVSGVREALSAYDSDGGVEVVIVDDGSSDLTSEAAHAAGADRVVTLDSNMGKGGAVRAGMLAARGRTLVFTDVDLAYPPSQISGLVDAVEEGWEVVAGSRRHPATHTVRRPGRLRGIGSFLFNLLTHFVLLGNYRDTQCGLKAFRADAAKEIFGRARVEGFAFDVEVLHLAERMELSLLELPVVLDHVEASTVKLVPQAGTMLRDVLRIRRWSATGAYGLDQHSRS